ncbi:MAG: M1 family metallopeptidase [Saprospiraceae bacterium]|nr:M1 family metallopeptidase [Pyrinomonadaceae bacterium]
MNHSLRNVSGAAAILLAAFFYVSAQSSRPDFNRAQVYDVQHYVLRVSFDRAKKTVFGDTTVQLKPLKAGLAEVELDAAGLDFESIALEPENTILKYRTKGEKVLVTLDRPYSPNETISLRFKYSATPKKGIYFVDEKTEDGQPVSPAQIWTQGEPDEAHHWFPSFDFPSDKATSEQIITVEKGETVIGNGELLGQKETADGILTFHFKMPVPHSTYLTSFVVGKYVRIDEKYKDLPLAYYVYPGRQQIVKQAYGKTRDILRVFEELTGVGYPFNKYDQTMVSNFTFGGMENITATTMADSEIFLAQYDFGKSGVEDLVSHEAAHSWFGNLVTCKNWAELWLNEGFATFMEAAFREKMYGRDSYIRKIIHDAEVFLADDAVNTKRNGLFNRNAGDINALFDRPATTYNKGGVVIHMLREHIGDEAFWKGVNLYLNRHKFANVESADLRKAMEEASGKDLVWFFDQWIYGLGSPNINVKQAYNPRTKILTLTAAQTQKPDKFTPPAFTLPLDVTITTASGSQTEKINLTKRLESFSIKVSGKPTEIKFDKLEKIPLKTVKVSPLK